jgi:peptidoglycan hydrolase-like protein with peptidoglycan-binding domain
MPEISPPMLGTWAQVSPSSLVFTPSGSWVPGTALTMTVPGGTQGIKSTDGRRLAKTVTARFSIALGSELRLEEILATLGYLPLSFTPADPAPVIPREEAEPLLGTFAWRWQSLPAQLTSLWTQGEPNLVTAGAVRTFEDQSGLATDGIAGPEVWTRLLQALAAAKTDPAPYDYVLVTTALPEHLQVWSEGKIVFSSAVNTGIAASPTPRGTWPVYLRFRSTTMQGTNPDGSHYNDPGVPWVSYFHGGDALHGFIRGGYGFPQSLGCVELPYAAAASVWPLTPIGTLVTVT